MSNTLHPFPTHFWKRVRVREVAAAGEGRGVALVSGEARQVTCRPTLDCSSASASALGMAPGRGVVELRARPVGPRTLCIYSQTVDAS